MKKKVIVTGSAGYIGRSTLDRLIAMNYEVHAVTFNSDIPEVARGLLTHRANLLDPKEVQNLIESIRATHLLHFAWYVEHGKFWNAPENLEWLQASLHIAKCFVANGGIRLVVAGSCAEYDWRTKSPISETSNRCFPDSLYGITKNSLALVLEKFAEIVGLSFASGKVFFSFGKRENPTRLIPSIIKSLYADEPIRTTHGRQIRDFLLVDEIARAFVQLLDTDVRGNVNIGSGVGVELKQIIEIIGRIMGKEGLLRIGALDAPGDEPMKIIADIKKLRCEVGFEPIVDLEGQLCETIDWWKKICDG